MNLTNTARYAIRIMSFMANEPDKLYSAKSLIKELGISDKYLRRIMTNLSKAKLIKAIRGRQGGYVFAKPIDEIYIINVVEAVEKFDKYTGCILGLGSCSTSKPCALHEQWKKCSQSILNIFQNNSLADISSNPEVKKK